MEPKRANKHKGTRRPTAPIGFDPAKWEPSYAVAARLRISRRQMCRVCVRDLAPAGVARLLRRRWRKLTWHVRRGIRVADFRRHRVSVPLPRNSCELAALPRHVRETAGERLRVLEGFWAARDAARDAKRHLRFGMSAYVSSIGGKPSIKTLYNWDARFRARGIIGLIDQRQLPRLLETEHPMRRLGRAMRELEARSKRPR